MALLKISSGAGGRLRGWWPALRQRGPGGAILLAPSWPPVWREHRPPPRPPRSTSRCGLTDDRRAPGASLGQRVSHAGSADSGRLAVPFAKTSRTQAYLGRSDCARTTQPHRNELNPVETEACPGSPRAAREPRSGLQAPLGHGAGAPSALVLRGASRSLLPRGLTWEMARGPALGCRDAACVSGHRHPAPPPATSTCSHLAPAGRPLASPAPRELIIIFLHLGVKVPVPGNDGQNTRELNIIYLQLGDKLPVPETTVRTRGDSCEDRHGGSLSPHLRHRDGPTWVPAPPRETAHRSPQQPHWDPCPEM